MSEKGEVEKEYPELTPEMVQDRNPFISTLYATMTIKKVDIGMGFEYTFDANLFESTPWKLIFDQPLSDEYDELDALYRFLLIGPDGREYLGTTIRSFDSGDHLPRYIEAQGRVSVFDTIHIGHLDDGTAFVVIFTVRPKEEFVPGAHSAQIFVWKKGFFDKV